MVACTAANGSWTLEVQERVGGGLPEAVGGLSLGSADQRLTLRAKACLGGLAAVEVVGVRFGVKCESPPALNV